MSERGPLTIPEAYDCGHDDNEARGHGMNRLVSAGLVVCVGWDPVRDDGLWRLTAAGCRVLQPVSDETDSTR